MTKIGEGKQMGSSQDSQPSAVRWSGAWQPIETAPRDGTTLVVGRDMGTWGFVRGLAYWVDCKGISGWVACAAFSDPPGVLGLAEPSHWHPVARRPVDHRTGRDPSPLRPPSDTPSEPPVNTELLEKVAREIDPGAFEARDDLTINPPSDEDDPRLFDPFHERIVCARQAASRILSMMEKGDG